MDKLQCKHFRVRDNNDYNMNIEEFVKSIETQFKIDFTSLPQWRKLIEIMHIGQTDYQTKRQKVENRKYQILKNIFIQNSRPTPFELTDKYARTYKVWQDMKLKLKNHKASKVKHPSITYIQDNGDIQELVGEESSVKSHAHPNTEEVQSNHVSDDRLDAEREIKSPYSSQLPVAICTNKHKLISPLGSSYIQIATKHKETDFSRSMVKSNNTKEAVLLSAHTKLAKSFPDEIIITNDTLKQQSVNLFVTNCCTKCLHIRFLKISDPSYFKMFKIFPCIPIKLFPGLTVAFKVIFTLKHKITDVKSSLHFRIGHNLLSESTEELLCVPITTEFIKSRTVSVTETVFIPPNYSWNITPKCGYPKTVFHIKNTDSACYYLYIRKKYVDFTKEFGEMIKSNETISPDSESLDKRLEDKEFEFQSTILSTPFNGSSCKRMASSHFVEENSDKDLDNIHAIVGFVLRDVLDQALETFIFNHTYLRIPPQSRKLLFVYFTRVINIGCHQSYYDFIFTDSANDNITITRTVKVFAEVLPNPITIQPKILDMSQSPVKFGYWEDHFKITNSHKILPVTIRVTTTTKMKKILKITPMETVIPAKSSANFNVNVCARIHKELTEEDDLAYFTIKILVTGHESVYENIPPLFYEIIAPCGSEFKRVYGTKYFSGTVDVESSK